MYWRVHSYQSTWVTTHPNINAYISGNHANINFIFTPCLQMGISIVFGSLINEIFGLFSKIPIVLILGKIGDVIFAENKLNIFVIIGHN